MRKSFNRYYQALFIGVFLVPGFEMFLAPPVSAEPAVEWERAYGGRNVDEAHAIQQTRDGGYIVAGGSKSRNADASQNHGLIDFWVIKLKEDGTLEWEKSLGGSKDDVAESIGQMTDGGYIVAGYSESNDGDVSGNHGNRDFWVVKLSAEGNMEWQRSLGGEGQDHAYSVQQTTAGGYVVAGS
ncbi:MAG: hypothetical protein LBT65_01525, partial [Synergistaceae bacterium]|nr:hypothetical protein [Synergistaceae bacterium]